jgi:hypothetical protein
MSYADFERHAADIRQRPEDFGVWGWVRAEDGTGQLEKWILDKYQRPVHVFIRASARYPETPPRVITRPAIYDACFPQTTGELNYARARESGGLVWAEYAPYDNPLALLVDELRRKYHML